MTERTYYVFLMSRPCDKGEAWPVVFSDKQRAETAEHRVSEVAEVTFQVNGEGNAQR